MTFGPESFLKYFYFSLNVQPHQHQKPRLEYDPHLNRQNFNPQFHQQQFNQPYRQQEFHPQTNQNAISPLNLQIAFKQNIFWFNTNMQLLNNGNLSPLAANLAKTQMDIARSKIFEIVELDMRLRHQDTQTRGVNVTNQISSSFSQSGKAETVKDKPREVRKPPEPEKAFKKPSDVVSNVCFAEKDTNDDRKGKLDKSDFEIYIFTVKSPDEFWFQYDGDKLEEFMEEMNNYYSTLPVDRMLCSFEVNTSEGTILAAYFLKFWHRARVVAEGLDDLEVFALDFGTNHIIPKRRARHLFSQFKKPPPKARKGKLFNFASPSGQWTSRQVSAFTDKITGEPMTATIKNVKNFVYELDIMSNGVNIADHLVKEGFGIHPTD